MYYRHTILDQYNNPSELGCTYATIRNQSEYDQTIQNKSNQINTEYNHKLQSLDELQQLIAIQNNTVNNDQIELNNINKYNDELKQKIDSMYNII